MLELVKFEYYRILRSKFIWVLAALAFILPLLAAIVINYLINGFRVSDVDIDRTNVRFFTWYVISFFYERLPLALAIFIPLFIGRDYKDGFIRNKLTAGHKRMDIFASAVITEITVTVVLSVLYVIGGLIGCSLTVIGCDLNNGEMLLRAFTLLLALISISVLFTAISLIIKSRAGTMVICIAFVFSLGMFSSLASNYSYDHKMIDAYEEIYEEMMESFDAGYYDHSELKFDKDKYFNTGWYIGHPLFLISNASLEADFIPSLSSMILDDDLFSYPKKISRLSFVKSYYSLIMGDVSGLLMQQDDLDDIPGAYVSYEEAELTYNIKSVMWSCIFFGAGYAVFRKKNIF